MPPDTEPAGWDPGQYLRFADARLRPAADLLARVPLAAPAVVVDLGCGPGTVTGLLQARFPRATLIGVDRSPAMLERARAAVPGARFVAADFATWRPEVAPDLIFSNAALHWSGGHETLFPALLRMLAPGGILAVQMPAMHDAPLRALQQAVAAAPPFAAHLHGVADTARAILPPEAYWDLLVGRCAALDMWETVYWHVLRGARPVVEWAEGSSLRPFLAALPEAVREPFRQAYDRALSAHYPRRPDGTVLLPFRRWFAVARV
ncbi:MAG: methyltransferase domain-containing protein [Acetobacteraceae bacterium]